MKQTIQTVSNEISEVLSRIDENQATEVSLSINQAARIFVTGEGRSGLMGKAFAMRLMHGDYPVYVTGETITPSIKDGDLLIAISGSGSTASIYQQALSAQQAGAEIIAITTNPESKLAEISDKQLIVPAATKKRLPIEPETIQPLGNQFDQSLHLLLDAIIIYSLNQRPMSSYEEMTKRHSNLE
ncbi:3-hexulose-6-phosphate isomerase [Halobacillus alkaliphilus]|uniref:3-hexulose-6-phosphate isomerase n=1 Tax=Halobacillus alkaliphilus TaxID=396056 RepID=A0A1I2M1T6_9BACI|nr:6-phospho-3-hexuloisomerase [Halobacillus alkaliphilus]SFF83261.1 3-hexulose-6-phosphate isomerase [Halobacillus alkaliphilus]